MTVHAAGDLFPAIRVTTDLGNYTRVETRFQLPVSVYNIYFALGPCGNEILAWHTQFCQTGLRGETRSACINHWILLTR